MPSDRTVAYRGEAGVARPHDKILIERIELRMAELQTNARRVSAEAQLGDTAVIDILRGKNRNPSFPVVKALAKALKCSLPYLAGQTDNPNPEPVPRATRAIPIIGIAEAGAFRHMGLHSQESELPTFDAQPSRRHPTARHFALEVRGDSMNAVREGPILEGMFVLCIDMADAGLQVESGNIYVVRRTLDQGQTYETTVKRARVFRDRVELVPESTNPKHQVIVVKRDFDADPAHEVMAIGLVYASVNDYERYRS